MRISLSRLLVFAYGSNLCEDRLRSRVPSAQSLAVASLPGYVLRFDKRSTDGSAKANAAYTGRAEDVVWGVVYSFLPNEKRRLDRAEGLGAGYRQEEVEVADETGQAYHASCYVAESNAIDATLTPYTWYKRFVVEGAQQHRLPHRYVELIRAIDAVEDPDMDRDAMNREIVCGEDEAGRRHAR